MTLAPLRLELLFKGGRTPRDTRRQVRGITDRLRRVVDVSVAGENRDRDPALVVAAVARSRSEECEPRLQVADAVAANPRAELVGGEIDEA
jgi:uncharacterized protein YlxP (DUF503 family)